MDKFLKKSRPREAEEQPDADAAAASKVARTSAASGSDAKPLAPEVASLIEHLTDPQWREALRGEVCKSYFAQIARAVSLERGKKTVFPPAPEVFSAFNLTPLPEVRVVVLGQDPYHGPGQAHGLAFSVARGVAVPPSLKNIYKELQDDCPGFKPPQHGHLAGWARQGVLMFNATLTVRRGEANSHAKLGWQDFTDAVIRVLDARTTPNVFILWGGFAQKKGKMISRTRHKVIEAAHPSPLSVTKFRGCRVFSKANEYLEQKGFAPIDWAAL